MNDTNEPGLPSDSEGAVAVLERETLPKIKTWEDFARVLESYKVGGTKNPDWPKIEERIKTVIIPYVKAQGIHVATEESILKLLTKFPEMQVVTEVSLPKPEQELRQHLGGYDFEKLYGSKGSSLKSHLERMLTFLEGPVITDIIDDHKDRRAWRFILEETYAGFNDHYGLNQLKQNRLSGVLTSLQFLRPFVNNLPLEEQQTFQQIYAESRRMFGLIKGEVVTTDTDGKEQVIKVPSYLEEPLYKKKMIVESIRGLARDSTRLFCGVKEQMPVLQAA